MKSGKSVGRRLILLVGCQTTIALLLVLVALQALSHLSADYRHMYNFQYRAVAAIGTAMEEAATFRPGSRSARLDSFYQQYRKEWETAAGITPDAIRFRRDLVHSGGLDLARHETEALQDLKHSLEIGDAVRIRKDLADLYNVNVRYADLEHQYVMARLGNRRIWLIAIGLAGISLTTLLGLHVRRAIAPRLKRLVASVRNFQEFGRHEPIGDTGKDDIGVLANALDAGFSAIALRETEREQFLAIAAHELKTPVTSIHGYASLLVSHLAPPRDAQRALDVINRQSWRLIRLIDALFLAMQARSGKLQFQPKPFDMSALVRRVLRELEPLLSGGSFVSRVQEDVSLLGDEALLEHALWSLFTCASAYSIPDSPVDVRFHAAGHRATLTIDIKGRNVSIPEVRELFMPFRSVEYETGSGIRSTIGLYLCREILRVHNGLLQVEQVSEERPEFLMELPV